MSTRAGSAAPTSLRTLRLMVFALVGGVLLGAGFALLAGLFYMIIIAPAILGAANGWLLAAGVSRWKVMRRNVAYGCAILMALSSFATVQTIQYTMWERGVVPAGQPARPASGAGLGGYLAAKAEEGLPLRIIRGRQGFVRLRGPIVWLYLGLEGIIIVLVTLWPVRQAVSRPYCDQCDSWKTSAHLGSMRVTDQESIIQAMHQQRYDHLLGFCQQTALEPPTLELYLDHCSCRDRDPGLRLGRAELSTGSNIAVRDVALVAVPYAKAGPLFQQRDRLA